MDENNFQLLEITGSEKIFDYNGSKNILVYSVGCMIVYWELATDKKMYIKYHEGLIGTLKFTKSGNYLVSVDKLFSPHIVVWEIPSLQIHFQHYLPLNSNYISDDLKYTRERTNEAKVKLIEEIRIEFLNKNNFILVINVDGKQLLFNFEFGRQINLLFDTTLEMESVCFGLKSIPNTSSFVTLEEKALKIWRLDESLKIKLTTKIHTKQILIKDSLQICEYLKLIVFLNDNGSCVILDDTGNFLISLCSNNRGENFTSSFVLNENLFLGTDRGILNVYYLNGFKLLGSVNYEFINKNKYLLNKSDILQTIKSSQMNSQMNSQLNYDNHSNQILRNDPRNGPLILQIFSDEDNDIIFIKYSDNSLCMTNLSHSFPNYLIKKCLFPVKYQSFNYSHFEKITDILWLNDDPKVFFTSSEDQSIMLWNYRGDRWVNNYFDLLKTFDQNLNNYVHKGDNRYFIQVLTLHPRYQNTIVGGDNKGSLYIFDSENLSQTKKIVVGNFPINILNFSKNGNYLSVGFETGLIILTDFYSDCKFCAKLEDHYLDTPEIPLRKNLYMVLSFVHIMKIKTGSLNNNNNMNSNRDVLQINKFSNPQIEKFSNNSNHLNNLLNHKNYYFSTNNEENLLRILTMKDANSLRLQNISVQKNNFLKSTFKEFSFDSKIKNVVVHPSEDYLIILMESNVISINRIETNQICGEIKPKMNIYDIKVDPSGLYLGILGEYINSDNEYNKNRDEIFGQNVNSIYSNRKLSTLNSNSTFTNLKESHALSQNLTSNLTRQRTFNKAFNSGNKEVEFNSLKTNLVFYELGTGKYANALNNNFKISIFKFSNDGRFINMCSDSGCVSIWQPSKEMRENILSVLEEMRKNSKFWDSFRINFIKMISKENNVSYADFITKSIEKSLHSIENKDEQEKNERKILRKMSREVQTTKPGERSYLNKAMYVEEDDKSAKSLYLNLSNTNNNQNYQIKNNNQLQTTKSVQTSFINKDIYMENNKKKSNEWNDNKKYERLGLENNMRVINKDPSIYPFNQPPIVTSGINSFKNSNLNVPIPNLNKAKVEETSKLRKDDIRNKNIENAMRELENFDSATHYRNNSYDTVNNLNNSNNYYINNKKQNKNQMVLPEPTDIDDIEDTDTLNTKGSYDNVRNIKNISNYSNPFKLRESITDNIEFAYDNIENFEKMHNLR